MSATALNRRTLLQRLAQFAALLFVGEVLQLEPRNPPSLTNPRSLNCRLHNLTRMC
jgi:hypothetical protein